MPIVAYECRFHPCIISEFIQDGRFVLSCVLVDFDACLHQTKLGQAGKFSPPKGFLVEKTLPTMLSSDIVKYRPVFSSMSFNIRYENPNDGPNSWSHRKNDVVSFLQKVKPDVFGLQEASSHQLEDVKKALPGYDVIGVGRTDGAKKGEHTPIFFNKLTFQLLNSGTFWLSDHPSEPGSKFEGASLCRICTWGKFNWLSNESRNTEFYLLNTHLDHEQSTIREKEIQVIIDFVKSEIPSDTPSILMGDFNAESEADPSIKLLASAKIFREANNTADNRAISRTFTGFDSKQGGVIDHVYYRGCHVSLYAVLKDKRENGMLLSDHRPIFCLLKTI